MLKEPKVRPGFAVEGIDREALDGVYNVLVEGEKPVEWFRAGTEVSIFFFTRPAQPVVRLERVERKGNVVEIRYVLISHGRQRVTHPLALIPLGQLPTGEYRVEMIRSMEKERQQDYFPPIDPGVEKRIVCRPFSFVVVEQP